MPSDLGSFTFQKLRLFCHVATLRSVTRAAEQLSMAQPAVTAQIRAMERMLGTALVRKEGRNLALTDAGSLFHAWCEDVLAKGADLLGTFDSLSDGTHGHATIAASMTAGTYRLNEILLRYKSLNPHTVVTTQIGNTRATTEAVRTGACDFAVLLLDPQQDLDGLEFEFLWGDPLLLVAPPDKAKQVSGDIESLARLPFIASPRNILRRTLEDEHLYSSGLISRRVEMELGHPEAIKAALKQGAGYSFIEKSAVIAEINRRELEVIPTPEIAISLPIYLARRRDKHLSAMHTRLIHFIRDEAREGGDAGSPPVTH